MAAMKLHITITSKEAIKPSSPTPNHLKIHKLSLLDQLSPRIYLPILLFYPNQPPHANTTLHLKNSLSKTLTRYFPFAGRLASRVSVDCNDEGVEFFEAQINCKLSELLEKPEPETLNLLYPRGILWNDSYEGSLVVVQVNFFAGGGMAIGMCFLHKIADGGSVNSFIRDWAATARNPSADRETVPLEFISASLFLSNDNDPPEVPESVIAKENCVTRRFVFEASKIAELKAMVAETGTQINPTRVEVVTALLYNRAVAATRRNSGCSRPSVLLQPVNMRPRISLPLPENSVGNFAWFFPVPADQDKNQKSLIGLVRGMRKGIEQFCNEYTKNKTANQCYSLVCDAIKEAKVLNKKKNENNDGVEVFKCSSLCRYGFDRINFGWGEPIWVGFSRSVVKNTFHLTDARGGGIEAWVTLEEQDMAALERDEELLGFASLNPSALDTSAVGNSHFYFSRI